MSVQATGPETLGSLSDEPEINDPNSKQAKEISGKSPMQIAFGRLRRDKIAITCAIVVLFFLLVAVFADLIAKAFGVTLDTVTACEVLECNFAEPGVGYPKTGPPFYPFDPEHPFGIAPRTGADNLAHWIQHPWSVKHGVLMPELGLSEADARTLAAYLRTHTGK